MYNEPMYTRHEMYENTLKERLQKSLGEVVLSQEVSTRVERRAKRYWNWLKVKSFFFSKGRSEKRAQEAKWVYRTQYRTQE